MVKIWLNYPLFNLHPLKLLQVHSGEAVRISIRKIARAKKTRERVEKIVRTCAFLAGKNIQPKYQAPIVDLILATLHPRQLCDIARGDYGPAYLEAMKLTLPYFSNNVSLSDSAPS